MRNLRIHYIRRSKVFTALCGATAGTTNADGTFNTCHFVPAHEPFDLDDGVCDECTALAFPQEARA